MENVNRISEQDAVEGHEICKMLCAKYKDIIREYNIINHNEDLVEIHVDNFTDKEVIMIRKINLELIESIKSKTMKINNLKKQL